MLAKWGDEAGFWRSGPVSEAPPLGIRTQKPLPKAPARGGGLVEGLLGPYAQRRSLRDRTGPPKPASSPHFANTHFAPTGFKTKPYEFIGFGAMYVTKPYGFIGCGAMYVTKTYEFICFGAMDDTRPCKFRRFGAMDVTRPCKFIRFGAMDVTKPSKCLCFGGCHQTL